MKKLTTNERLKALRNACKSAHVHAFIIPSTDPHLSEYVAPHWKSREWISGFNGSAGTVVVTSDKAGLWTDSRYFLQAETQLEGSDITLYREMLANTPSIPAFLCETLKPGDRVGIDGKMFSERQVEIMKSSLEANGIQLLSCGDLMEQIWTDRPALPTTPASCYNLQYAGVSCRDKVSAIRTRLQKEGADSLFVSALDEIAWTLNLRGEDVHCNPVIISYLLITPTEIIFFIDPKKITTDVKTYLTSQLVAIKPYSEVEVYLNQLPAQRVLMNPETTNHAIYSALNPACTIIRSKSPVALLKAIRNEQEIAGLHRAMEKDGVAMVKFLKWLEESVPLGNESELTVDAKLHELRSEQPLYMGKSFDTIAGYKEHGAMNHYTATKESCFSLETEGFLLVDSGGQYLDGTTDITRTIALGKLTDEEKTDYTLVLKGHIALSMAKFPEGTRGVQLDVLARMPLWSHGMNFLHGTGHGVGHFLSVHEGPQSIRMNENPIVLQPGMLTSNEPGAYKDGSHGIRIENLILVCKDQKGMYGEYFKFETVTLCPICTKGVIKEMLTQSEIAWLNEYHETVYHKLSPFLSESEKSWLKHATQTI